MSSKQSLVRQAKHVAIGASPLRLLVFRYFREKSRFHLNIERWAWTFQLMAGNAVLLLILIPCKSNGDFWRVVRILQQPLGISNSRSLIYQHQSTLCIFFLSSSVSDELMIKLPCPYVYWLIIIPSLHEESKILFTWKRWGINNRRGIPAMQVNNTKVCLRGWTISKVIIS